MFVTRRVGMKGAVLFAILGSAILGACGGGGNKASQVAVKVDKDEITVTQVNGQLARLPAGFPADQADAATREIISRLIDQQLLVQQAIDKKLDRDPQVLGALEAARANILAQAYVQRNIAPQAKPSEQEITKYYNDNPDLFAQRKVYRLAELTIQANAEQQKAIAGAVPTMKSLKQFADFLNTKKIPFAADSGVRTAEQLPLGQLPTIAKLKSGSVLAFATGPDRVTALEVLASEDQPVDQKRATPAIEQFLANGKREQILAEDLKRLRGAAKIEYVGDYAKYAVNAPAPAAASAAQGANAPPPAPQAQQPATNETAKGIAGLH